MTRVKMFETTWNIELDKLETEINEFLAKLPGSAQVKNIQTAMAAVRNENDQTETEYVVTVWYEV